jgi:hypothetical protein
LRPSDTGWLGSESSGYRVSARRTETLHFK